MGSQNTAGKKTIDSYKARQGHDPESIKWGYAEHLRYTFGVDRYTAHKNDKYMALALAVRDTAVEAALRVPTVTGLLEQVRRLRRVLVHTFALVVRDTEVQAALRTPSVAGLLEQIRRLRHRKMGGR